MRAYRSPVVLTDLLRRDFTDRFRLATLIGLGAAAVAWLLLGAVSGGTRVAPATDAIVVGVVDLVVSLVTYVLLLTHRTRRALEAVWWLANLASERYGAATGDRRVPATPAAASAWLERHPSTEATRGMRVFCQLVVGNLTAAWEEAQHLADATPVDRFHRDAGTALIRFVEGGDVNLVTLRQAASHLEGSDGLNAAGDVATLETLLAVAEGRDWRSPMLEFRERLGPRASRLLFRPLYLPVGASILLLAAITAGAGVVARWSFRLVAE